MRQLVFLSIIFYFTLIHIGVIGKTTTYVIQRGEVKSVESPNYEDIEDISTDNEYLTEGNEVNYTTNGWTQGICQDKRQPLIYTENFILEKDNTSDVTGTMEISIAGNSNITCVEVINRDNSTQPPIYLKGGMFSSAVLVGVLPGYGKGFDFTVKLYGTF